MIGRLVHHIAPVDWLLQRLADPVHDIVVHVVSSAAEQQLGFRARQRRPALLRMSLYPISMGVSEKDSSRIAS